MWFEGSSGVSRYTPMRLFSPTELPQTAPSSSQISSLPHKCIFHRGFNPHLYSRPSCLLIYQFLPPSFLRLKSQPTTTEPELRSWMWPSWMHWVGSHSIRISNASQKQCDHARYINIHKICLPFSLFSFSLISLYLSIFTMYNTHSKDFFLSMLGAWLIQRPTTDK